LNNLFLEEYKKLDKLCREMYSSEKGVTAYIDDMKSILSYESRNIPNWDVDLKKLIELRHIRNQLSHEVGTFNSAMCSQADIYWLRDFYNRIMSQDDPLSIYNHSKHNRKSKDNNCEYTRIPTLSESPQQHSNMGCLTTIAIFTILTIFISMLICHNF